MKRKAHVVWKGDGENGSGTLSTGSGAIENLPYNFKMRFKNDDGKLGTNPVFINGFYHLHATK